MEEKGLGLGGGTGLYTLDLGGGIGLYSEYLKTYRDLEHVIFGLSVCLCLLNFNTTKPNFFTVS